jgi:L-fucose isomerase-like protein
MPVTMSRLNMVDGLGPVLQIAEGWTVDLDPEVHDIINRRTDKTWPTTWFAPRLTGKGPFKDVYSVMNNWGANHGAISYGHIGQDLITLASILRILYVCTTWMKMKSSVHRHGMLSGWTKKVQISAPARISAPFINNYTTVKQLIYCLQLLSPQLNW